MLFATVAHQCSQLSCAERQEVTLREFVKDSSLLITKSLSICESVGPERAMALIAFDYVNIRTKNLEEVVGW